MFGDGKSALPCNPNPSHPDVCAAGEARWYAVYTTCRHEKKVAQHLAQRGVEHFLPLYAAHRKWRDGSKVVLELPLFPCYLFVRIGQAERVHVLGTPGALALVGGTGGEPAELPEAVLDALRQGVDLGLVEPHPLLTTGQQVRIRSGAFAGMQGVIQRRKNGCRVVLMLAQMMQSVAVEVGETDVEPVESGARQTPGLLGFGTGLDLVHA